MVSNIFAHLPNGIIREIVSYTGATYKKRNGKYIGQISKDDPRYAMVKNIPSIETKELYTFTGGDGEPDIEYLCCEANLTRDRYDYTYAYLKFISIKTINKTKFSSENDLTYSFYISSLNTDPNLPYLREYTFREGDVVKRIKKNETIGQGAESLQQLTQKVTSSPDEFGQRIRYLLVTFWFGISFSVAYYLGSANV